jgi:hypothetical protein
MNLWPSLGLVTSDQHLPEDAAAAEHGALAKVITSDGFQRPAVTSAHESGMPFLVAIVKPDDGQSSDTRRRLSELAELWHV